MCEVKRELLGETNKWQKKLEEKLKKVDPSNDKSKRFKKNAEAYFEDSKYFLRSEDYVRAFECVIWGWAWLEVGEKEDFI